MEVSGEINVFGIDWEYAATWEPRQKATLTDPSEGGFYDDVSIFLQGECVDKLLTRGTLDTINSAIQDLGAPEDDDTDGFYDDN